MFHRLFVNVMQGILRGSLIAFLTSLIFPLCVEGANIITSLMIGQTIFLFFLNFPEMYIVTLLRMFGFYIIPCILTGVILQFLSTKRIGNKLIFVLIFGIATYIIIGMYFSVTTTPVVYPLIYTIVIVSFQYFCFFVWRRSAD